MVEPTTPDVAVTVSGEMHARAQAAYKAYADALELATDPPTARHARALSAARSRLAAVYRELASVFAGSEVLFEAFDRAAAYQFDSAKGDERWAELLEASTFGGGAQ